MTKRSNDKWVERWIVPSSSGNGNYIISRDAEGNYACSCRGWTLNVRKYCPDCGLQLARKDPYCWKCKKPVENPRTERIQCQHIRIVLAGSGKRLSDATIDILAGRE